MKVWQKVKEWIGYNRFFIIGIIVAIFLWTFASCGAPTVESPTRPGVLVNADDLQLEYEGWLADCNIMQKKFARAGKNLEELAQAQNQLKQILIDIANGNVTDVKSTLLLFAFGAGGGAILDNIRKRGLIASQKTTIKNLSNCQPKA